MIGMTRSSGQGGVCYSAALGRRPSGSDTVGRCS